MQFVYGYRSYDVRNNLHYDKEKNIIYHTASIGIVYNTRDKKRPQKFYLDHSDDIISCDVFENKVATG
jgi:microtubule-associated protein-like 6